MGTVGASGHYWRFNSQRPIGFRPMPPFSVPVRPRYGEVDAMGVVYHAHYLVYFELGRTEFMRARGIAYASIEERGLRLAVVDAGLQYRRPARYDQPCRVEVEVSALGRARVTFAYRMLGPDGDLLATGHTELGCLTEASRPTRLPEDVRAALAPGSPTPADTSTDP